MRMNLIKGKLNYSEKIVHFDDTFGYTFCYGSMCCGGQKFFDTNSFPIESYSKQAMQN